MRTITHEQALAALSRLAEAHPDRVNEGCTYVHHDDRPNCMIGAALIEDFGVSVEFFHGPDIVLDGQLRLVQDRNGCSFGSAPFLHTLRTEQRITFDEDARDLLNEVQQFLDSRPMGGRYPWRLALDTSIQKLNHEGTT